ncbi:hypothetical protein AAHA92_19263 [Salvia divinorum]|uniref:Uncharacterized protein n=1 Tax=Salvia divinorum TaxID=28513 RepID=A0ABD1H4S3_SALDI
MFAVICFYQRRQKNWFALSPPCAPSNEASSIPLLVPTIAAFVSSPIAVSTAAPPLLLACRVKIRSVSESSAFLDFRSLKRLAVES